MKKHNFLNGRGWRDTRCGRVYFPVSRLVSRERGPSQVEKLVFCTNWPQREIFQVRFLLLDMIRPKSSLSPCHVTCAGRAAAREQVPVHRSATPARGSDEMLAVPRRLRDDESGPVIDDGNNQAAGPARAGRRRAGGRMDVRRKRTT